MQHVFFSFKTERVLTTGEQTIIEARKGVGHYFIEYYNRHRLYLTNGGLSPIQAEESLNNVSE